MSESFDAVLRWVRERFAAKFEIAVLSDQEDEPVIVLGPHGSPDAAQEVALYFVDNHAVDVVHSRWVSDDQMEEAFVGREEVDDLELFDNLAAAIEDEVPATAWEKV